MSVGQPYDPSKGHQQGPASWGYSTTKKYFFSVSNNGQEGVVWQDQDTMKIFLSWLSGKDMSVVSNFELPTAGMSNPILNAAAGNDKGEVVAWAGGWKCAVLMCAFVAGVGLLRTAQTTLTVVRCI